MNKILIDNNVINNYEDDYIIIKDNKITFIDDCEYEIEYFNCSNINLDIDIKKGVNIRLFIYSIDNNININNKILLNEESSLLLSKFYTNNITNEEMIVNLDGRLATFNCGFSGISKNEDNYHFVINHNTNKTISNVVNRAVTLDKSSAFFDIDSIVLKDADCCKLNQATKIITLGDSNSKIKPNMYIDKYDVEAKHSSVIGKFSDEEIFYLESRGIEYNDALKLLIKGFLLSNITINLDNRANILKIINSYWR